MQSVICDFLFFVFVAKSLLSFFSRLPDSVSININYTVAVASVPVISSNGRLDNVFAFLHLFVCLSVYEVI